MSFRDRWRSVVEEGEREGGREGEMWEGGEKRERGREEERAEILFIIRDSFLSLCSL